MRLVRFLVFAALLSPVVAVAGENYAFLVGVADYDKKELKPLQFTRSDILELHQVLVDAGYDKANIVLMHDDPKNSVGRRFFPEAAKIREELRLLLAGLTKDDSLIVAFSGHGVQFKGQRQNYFCPADAKLDDRSTLIALSDLYASLEKCSARQKLLLVDACRDDPQSQLGKARQTVDLESVTRPQTEEVPEGLVALFSCGAGQRSFEDPELKHGVFFYHVLEGLKGEARNSEGQVTLDDLVSFTRTKTQKFARTSLAAIQTPQQLGDFTGTWVLRSLKTTTPVNPPTPAKPTTPTNPPTPAKTTTPAKPPTASQGNSDQSLDEVSDVVVTVSLRNSDRKTAVSLAFGDKPEGRKLLEPGQESSYSISKSSHARYFNGEKWLALSGPGKYDFSVKVTAGKSLWVATFEPNPTATAAP